jgi:hypothetical protein
VVPLVSPVTLHAVVVVVHAVPAVVVPADDV